MDLRLYEGLVVLDVIDQPINVPAIEYIRSADVSQRDTQERLSTAVRFDCCD